MVLTREIREKLTKHYTAPDFAEYALQIFAEAVQGRKIVYLFRIASKEATANGTTLAFTTENTRSILAKGDTMINELEEAMDADELMEIWEANLDEPAEAGDNKFEGRYFQGYLTEFEKTSSAEDYVECSLTFGINGSGVAGDVTVTTEQQEIAAYAFKDTQKTGA